MDKVLTVIEGARMTNAAAYDNTYYAQEERCCYYSWIEDCLERLEGKEVYREFQERHLSEYCVLVASLAA